MRLSERLAWLDNQVMGQPKAVTNRSYWQSFLVGLLGTAVVLVALAITDAWQYVWAVGGFLGVMLGGGFRWWRTRSRVD